jgi:hypothetical protein
MTSALTLPALGDLQWSLDAGIVMGPGSLYNVQSFTVGGASSDRQDVRMTSMDGQRFGIDTAGGRLITLDLNTDCYTEIEGRRALGKISAAWDSRRTRLTPGAVQVLRWRRGQDVRRAYGRARDLLPVHDIDWTGNIGITATFQTDEPYFYDDIEQTEYVPFVPDPVGGLVGPVVGDLVASGEGVSTRGFSIGGDTATWVPFVIYGPIVNPRVEFVDQYAVEFRLSLGADDYVVVDPWPYNRGIRLRNGGNAAGRLTAASRVLSGMQLEPGHHTAILTGNDPTGTSAAVIYWRDAYTEH